MAYPTNCILHSPLEANVGGKVISAIGPDGTITGNLVFAPAKYNNGVRATSTTDGHAEFGNLGLQTKGCVEVWIKHLVNSSESHVDRIVSFADTNMATTSNVISLLLYSTGQYYVNFFTSGVNKSIYYQATWNNGDLVHLAFSWDESGGLEGNNYAVLYLNGVKVAGVTTSFTISLPLIKTGLLLYYYDGAILSTQKCFRALGDNIKVWNYAKTDFSDRFDEFGAKPRHQVIFI